MFYFKKVLKSNLNKLLKKLMLFVFKVMIPLFTEQELAKYDLWFAKIIYYSTFNSTTGTSAVLYALNSEDRTIF